MVLTSNNGSSKELGTQANPYHAGIECSVADAYMHLFTFLRDLPAGGGGYAAQAPQQQQQPPAQTYSGAVPAGTYIVENAFSGTAADLVSSASLTRTSSCKS